MWSVDAIWNATVVIALVVSVAKLSHPSGLVRDVFGTDIAREREFSNPLLSLSCGHISGLKDSVSRDCEAGPGQGCPVATS